MGRYDHSLSLDANIMASKNCPTIGEYLDTIFVTEMVTIATVLLAKTPLITALGAYNSKSPRGIFFIYYQHLISMIRRNF